MARSPERPSKSESPAGYSGTPLSKKLGIKPGYIVDLVDAPPGFEGLLDELPDDVRIKRRTLRGAIASTCEPAELAIWFVQSMSTLSDGARHFVQNCPAGGVWFAWRKKTAKARTRPPSTEPQIGESDIRRAGLAVGLVDFKICAVDSVWSGLKFTLRQEDRKKRSGSQLQK